MTVSTSLRKQQFVLDGVTAAFTFTFRARTATAALSDIKCIVTDGDGVDTDLTYTTHYTVAVNANGIGGTVTLVDETLWAGTLTVYRETTNTQGSDYDDYNQFPADTLEEDLDIRTLVDQEQSEALGRSVILPISVSGVSGTLPVPSADKVLGWNSGATALENKTPNTDAYLTLASEAEAKAGTDNTKVMTPLRVKQAQNRVGSISISSGTLAIDGSLYDVVNTTVDDDFKLNMATGGSAGDRITIRLTQDGVGNHLITLGSGINISAELAADGIVLSTAAEAIDKIGLYCVSASLWEIDSFGTDYSEPA